MSQSQISAIFVLMYVRKKKNKSGKVSVQVIDKSSGRYKVVKTIGCSASASEISRLVNQGKQWIIDYQGHQLIDFEHTLGSAQQFLSRISLIEPCGADIILGNIFDEIGFSSVDLPLFKPMVISRLVFPSSKLKTTERWYEHGKGAVQVDTVYRMMDKLYGLQEQVQQLSYQHTVKILGSSPHLLFYDVTTLYFEVEREDHLRKTGFSKGCPPGMVSIRTPKLS